MRNINWEAVALLTAFFSIGFLPGWLQFALVLTNALSFIISGFILINIANLKNYRKQKSHSMDFFNRNGVLGVMGVAAFGIAIAIYDLWVFRKSPLKKEFDSMQQQNRDQRLKDLGI